MIDKEKMAEALDFSHQEVRNFVNALRDEQRLAAGTLEHWSAKDIVAHQTDWIARLLNDLELAGRADASHAVPPNYDNIDETNAEIYARHQDQSWEEILDGMEAAYRAVKAFARAASETELADQQRIPWREGRPFWRMLVGTAVEHPILHLGYFQIENGNIAEAARLQETCLARLLALDDSPGWRGLQIYNLACIQSLTGQNEKALANLIEALGLQPDLVEWSKQDPDLAGLHDHPAFQAIYAG